MEFADFDKQFYYDEGSKIAEVGTVLYHSTDHIYYTVVRDHETGDVLLVGNNGGVREPDKDFIHGCVHPPDPAHIPELPS